MKNQLEKLSFSLLLASTILSTACSSGGSSGGGGGGGVPTGAPEITAATAEGAIATAVASTLVIDAALAIETTPTMGLMGALEIVKPRLEDIKNTLKNSGADLVYGIDGDDSGSCDSDGTYSTTGHSTGLTGPTDAGTDTGTATLVNCDDGFGFVLNGTISWSDSWDNATGDYSETLTGTITIEQQIPVNLQVPGVSNPTFSFSGIDFAKTGNNLNFGTETYTLTKVTFTHDRITNGVGGNGFLASLSADVVESDGGGINSCPESGSILITGGNNTTAEGIYNGNGTMTIKANGVEVGPASICFYYFQL